MIERKGVFSAQVLSITRFRERSERESWPHFFPRQQTSVIEILVRMKEANITKSEGNCWAARKKDVRRVLERNNQFRGNSVAQEHLCETWKKRKGESMHDERSRIFLFFVSQLFHFSPHSRSSTSSFPLSFYWKNRRRKKEKGLTGSFLIPFVLLLIPLELREKRHEWWR